MIRAGHGRAPSRARKRTGAATLLAAVLGGAAMPALAQTLDPDWMVRLAPGDPALAAHPQAGAWHPARVPGSVQSDLLRAGLLPDPYFRDNEARVQWVGLADWRYRTTLHLDAGGWRGDHLDLVFDGIDTFGRISINGVARRDTDDMFRRYTITDVQKYLHAGDNVIEVALSSPVTRMQSLLRDEPTLLPGEFDSPFGDEPKGRQTQSYVRKAGFHYGWDWGPRIIVEGLWQPVRLVRRGPVALSFLHVDTTSIQPGGARVALMAQATLDRAGRYRARATLAGPDGRRVTIRQDLDLPAGQTDVVLPATVPRPRLWWPVGYGRPDRYRVTFALENRATHARAAVSGRTGLRIVRLLRDRDAHGRGFGFEINGVPIFAKGASLIPLDMLEDRVTNSRIDHLLSMARAANMNMIRVWGGGLYGSDRLYDRADALGLMVWQDFAFGGAITPPDAAFAATVEEEATDQVRRLRDHPSLVLWCGNNEMETGWDSWPDRLAFARALSAPARDRITAGMKRLFGDVLPRVTARLDPQTPYWDTSPGSGFDGPVNTPEDGDMHLWSVWSGGRPIADYLSETPRFASEYGLQSLPALSTLRAVMAPGDLDIDTPVMRAHQKFAAGRGNDRLLHYITENYGAPRDFAAFAYLSQVMQADGIALAAEHFRSSRPRTMGSLYWQLNDVWPGPSWSAIDHDDRPKALWYRTRAFYAPEMITVLPDGDGFTLSAVSDATAPLAIQARLDLLDVTKPHRPARRLLTITRTLPALCAMTLGHVPRAGLAPDRDVLVATLVIGGRTVSRRILPVGSWRELRLPDPRLTLSRGDRRKEGHAGDGNTVTIAAGAFAHAVAIDTDRPDAPPDDDFFDLLPGERRVITVPGRVIALRSLAGATR